MNWIKKYIGNIGLWVLTITFIVYYFIARPLDVSGLKHPVWVDNIELYGQLIGILFVAFGYALNCIKRIERVIIAWGFVAFWSMLSLTYFLNEFFYSILFTHKIITVIIISLISCPFFYFYFRKRL